ncbi:beta-1,3-galactosyltransferase 1 [Periophthalmus magnuspinnatus]|uniref:beta-1,3-galactosyltransferase 1 n=1 Tax=Periophthalmus magnuspinnatus TaxID=409849 RepID=UPI0024363A4A|nr:beta-1,3-galactosyltransferase 1 [Periophthalmus magnuspinnatus]
MLTQPEITAVKPVLPFICLVQNGTNYAVWTLPAMKRGFPWRLFRIIAVFAVLIWSFYAFRGSKQSLTRPALLSDKDYQLISPQTYTYIHNQPQLCSNRTEIFVVFLVPVAPHNYAAREAVRKTWGAPGVDTLTLFFLGLPEDSSKRAEIQDKVEEESKNYGDIIQINFIDSYQNLTIKTLMMMRWLDVHCPQTRYGMKVDADIFVNVFYLKDYLKFCPRRSFITGSVINDGAPRRNSESKWHLSEQEYPEDTFPPYVSGAGYVFSWDLAGRISLASRFFRVIPLEDVYVGLCLRLLEVRPEYAYSLVPLVTSLFEVRNLEYDRCRFAKLIIVNGFSPSKLIEAWRDFTHGNANC